MCAEVIPIEGAEPWRCCVCGAVMVPGRLVGGEGESAARAVPSSGGEMYLSSIYDVNLRGPRRYIYRSGGELHLYPVYDADLLAENPNDVCCFNCGHQYVAPLRDGVEGGDYATVVDVITSLAEDGRSVSSIERAAWALLRAAAVES